MRPGILSARPVVSIILLAAALAVGAAGFTILFSERGAANEIKGFVLLLIAAVLFVGGCVLWELRALRKALDGKDRS